MKTMEWYDVECRMLDRSISLIQQGLYANNNKNIISHEHMYMCTR